MNLIELPPMPKLEDFPGYEYGYSHTMYQMALAAWERVCLALINSQKVPAQSK